MKYIGGKGPENRDRLGLGFWRWLRSRPNRSDPQMAPPPARWFGFRNVFKFGRKK